MENLPTQQMLFYLLLHVAFGIATGGALRYLRSRGHRPPLWRSWLVYALTMIFCFAAAVAIGRYPRGEVHESWRLWGVGLLALAFFLAAFRRARE